MRRFLYEMLALLVVAIAVAATGEMYAQTADVDHEHDGVTGPVICGQEWLQGVDFEEVARNTARINPEVYQKMVEAKGKPRVLGTSGTSSEGLEVPWFVFDRLQNAYILINATCLYQGPKVRIWVENSELVGVDRIRQTTIDKLAEGLEVKTSANSRDPNKGIIENDIEMFGQPPVNQFDQEIISEFLIVNIQSGIPFGSILGYFSPNDQTSNEGSNYANLLYIAAVDGLDGNAPQSKIDEVLGTIAHEFQHLIHYERYGKTSGNSNSDRFLNEGLSEVASIRLGYIDRLNGTEYLNVPNVELFGFPGPNDDGTELNRAYARAMTVVHYLSEQFGDDFLYNFVYPGGPNIQTVERVKRAMEMSGDGSDWQSVMTSYAIANYLQTEFTESDPRYGYKVRLNSNQRARAVSVTVHPGSEQVNLEPYGAYYALYTNVSTGGAARYRFTGSKAFGVAAIIRNGSDISVQELNKDQDYVIGPFQQVVFAIASHDGGQQTVTWTSEEVTLSVDDGDAANNGLKFGAAVPNPFAGETMVSFATENAGAVTMEIYNMRGEKVAIPVAHTHMEPGDHEVVVSAEGLPNGPYMVRLVQGEQVVSRSIVLMK